jgi:nucleoid-associated protein YgaU
MLSLTTPIKIGLAAACLVVVAIIIAVDVARTRGAETPVAPAPAATALVEALPPAFQPPKAATDAVICPAPTTLPAPEAPKPPVAVEPVKEKAPEEPPKTYTIVQGDSLYGISQKMFGSPRYYEKIYELNKDRIKDPNTLQVGINLRMPDVAVKPAR